MNLKEALEVSDLKTEYEPPCLESTMVEALSVLANTVRLYRAELFKMKYGKHAQWCTCCAQYEYCQEGLDLKNGKDGALAGGE